MFLDLKVLSPRKIAELKLGVNPAGRTLEGLKDIQVQKKFTGTPLAQTTLVAVTESRNPIAFRLLTIDVSNPRAPQELGHAGGGATKSDLTLLPDVANLALAGPNPCAPPTPPPPSSFTGEMGLTSTYNNQFSFVSFYDLTNRNTPCLLSSKLLTANPDTLTDFSVRGTVHATGYAKGVAALQDSQGYTAYTAVSEVGLFATDLDRNIPEILPAVRPRDPLLAGDYVDVAAVGGRLVALNRGTQQLEIVDPNLTVLGGVDLPDLPRRLLYVPRMPFDANGDGTIGPSEFIDAAIVGADHSVAIVDVTNILNPQVVSAVPVPLLVAPPAVPPPAASFVRDVDVDRAKLRLYVVTDGAWYMVDLGKRQTIGLIDANHDLVDDRVTWKEHSANLLYTVKADTDRNNIYVGTEKGLEVFDFGPPGLTGTATFTFVPVDPVHGLDYANMEPRPIRGAVVELRSSGSVLATTNTDANGYYSFDAAPGATLEVVVKAALGKPGSETVTVINNTDADKLWTKSSGTFAMPPSATKNIYAETSFESILAPASSYPLREAAPFAILDMAYLAQEKIRTVDPAIVFPPLKMAWSPNNVDALMPDGSRNYPLGLIKTSHWVPADETLYILGGENADTDEYDSQVVLHEWSHYFQDRLSRSDGIGGGHGDGELLDPRVAFEEGFATAFASMLTGDKNYVDTSGFNQHQASLTDVEKDSNPLSSFYSEDAVIELVWDLFDGPGLEVDQEHSTVAPTAHQLAWDHAAFGFKPIYAAMRGGQKTTNAFTTIFSFLDALDPSHTNAEINEVANLENIDFAHANKFELTSATPMVIQERVPGSSPPTYRPAVLPDGATVSVGRLYNVLALNTPLLLFGPGPFANQVLRTRTRFEIATDKVGNKFNSSVFFGFEITQAGRYELRAVPVAPASQAVLGITVNSPLGTQTTSVSNGAGAVQSVQVELQPGIYTVAVRARGVDPVSGDWVPTSTEFSIGVYSIRVP